MERTPSDYEKLDKLMDYEERGIPSKAIAIWVGGLVFALLLVMGLMYLIAGVPQAVPRPDIVTKRAMLQPTLQADPAVAMRRFRKEQQAILSSYGWVDKAQGVVRLPIDVAMDLAIQRGIYPHEGKR
jgi:hypothetical protein